MEKPFVVCHMFTSMDGKIDGAFMGDPAAVPARTEYGRLRNFYECDAVLYGTVTMMGGFSDALAEDLPAAGSKYPMEDWVAPHEGKNYVVSVDPKGILGWNSGYMERKGRARAHVIEVLTTQVSTDYLAYLRENGVSYLLAGEERIDCPLLLHKLKTVFGIEKLMLAGGGYMNGSFLSEGLIDEVSIVMAPVADGNTSSVSIFEYHDFLPHNAPMAFSLTSADRVEGDGLWLRYTLKK